MLKLGDGMGVEAMSAIDANVVKEGGKYDGCAILWNPSIKGQDVPIGCDHNRRCGILRKLLNNATLIILNAYMP